MNGLEDYTMIYLGAVQSAGLEFKAAARRLRKNGFPFDLNAAALDIWANSLLTYAAIGVESINFGISQFRQV